MELIVSDFHAKIIQVLKFLGAKLVKKNLVQVCHLLSLILGCKILFVLDDAYIFIFHLLDTLEYFSLTIIDSILLYLFFTKQKIFQRLGSPS